MAGERVSISRRIQEDQLLVIENSYPCASEFAWRTTKCHGWHAHKLKIQMTRLTVNPSVAENEADAEAKVSIQFLGLVTAT
jgi:hypothetical protein